MIRKTVQIRFTDIDEQQHANHTAILAWIAEARIEMLDDALRRLGLLDKLDYVMVRVEADFLREVRHPGEVTIHGEITKVGDKSCTTDYVVQDQQGGVVARARCVNVFFDRAAGIAAGAVLVPEGITP